MKTRVRNPPGPPELFWKYGSRPVRKACEADQVQSNSDGPELESIRM